MTEFMRPTVTTEEVNDTVARYIVEPLERGYGNTLGNSMRRVLLSSLDGAKATAIQIEGVQHEFTTAEGVIEDITDIVLNVKGLVFSADHDDMTEATAHVTAEGPCVVTGADLEVPTGFTLVNPEHRYCHRCRWRSAGHDHPHWRGARLCGRRAQQAHRATPSASSMWTRCSRRCAVAP